MPIVIRLDVALAQRKMKLNELADAVNIALPNLSILKTGKAKAIRFSTLEAICAHLDCQPGDLLEYVRPKKLPDVESSGSSKSDSGFTLVELLVCLAVVALFSALVFAGFYRARESALTARGASNLRQIYLGTQAFAADNEGCIPPPVLTPNRAPGTTENPTFNQLLATYLPTSKQGDKSVWICPRDNRTWENVAYPCSYGMNATITSLGTGAEGQFFSQFSIKRLSTKIFLADSGGDPGPVPMIYYAPSGLHYRNIAFRHGGRMHRSDKPYGSRTEVDKQAGKANMLFFDGHVQALGYSEITDQMWVTVPGE